MYARHNVAPNPPPKEIFDTSLNIDEYLRYGDSVWDQRRLNNLNQHFVTDFLGIHLKNKETYKSYLDVKKILSKRIGQDLTLELQWIWNCCKTCLKNRNEEIINNISI